jgi:hypothetical protein
MLVKYEMATIFYGVVTTTKTLLFNLGKFLEIFPDKKEKNQTRKEESTKTISIEDCYAIDEFLRARIKEQEEIDMIKNDNLRTISVDEWIKSVDVEFMVVLLLNKVQTKLTVLGFDVDLDYQYINKSSLIIGFSWPLEDCLPTSHMFCSLELLPKAIGSHLFNVKRINDDKCVFTLIGYSYEQVGTYMNWKKGI